MFQLSYSGLSTMKSCKRCFYFDRKLKLPRPQGIKSSMPTAVDEILKSGFEVFREIGDLPPVLRDIPKLKGFQLYKGADLKKMRHWASNPYSMKDKAGNKIIGAFDDILYNPSTDTYAYLDYKTTGKEPAQEFGEKYYQSQCDIYTNFMIHGKKNVADFGVLLFFWPIQNPEILGEVTFSSKAIILTPCPEAAEETFKDAIDLLMSDVIPDSGENCEYCKFVDCRVGAMA